MDVPFMKLALREARKGLGRTSPNPMVGAVIVREGAVVAKGYHRRAGLPHAEIEALRRVGHVSPGDTLYVTLEPCNHVGRTPPCTQAILNSGIRRVVVGMKDPNPSVAGGGCAFLKAHDIEVTVGVLETECRRLNEDFLTFVLHRRPFVIAKSALTMDGWTATSTGHSKWITNDTSRAFVHRLRDRVDAVMVGIGTVLSDDPSLTTRLSRGRGKDPLRIIVDTHLKTPLDAKIVTQRSTADTLIVIGQNERTGDREAFQTQGVSILVCPAKGGRIDLSALMTRLGEMSVSSLLVEGGAAITGTMLRERLIDKFYIFVAPKLLGGDDGIPMAAGPGPKTMDASLVLKEIKVKRFGDDTLIRGYPAYPDR
ncbi:MAG: bifunctional diaminohydroxyphosphoribosylaminopyrimidine deaminase/5-amino-6-(5-phosphoribosylamino)uracil reductase RibD [Deltaproteobacteria bacterium]|nr:bifunctional diaminohydroxyphosphoribosylaminopyrimidine deaminase/5-amino-6-(5-phosphoribosylamino)uracil reductase RibD [Deltaproteobacteria bacterium]